jgi:hypothetical protein
MSIYWKIEITTLDPNDKIKSEYWRMKSVLGSYLGNKNNFDTEEKAKQVFDALPQSLKDKSNVKKYTGEKHEQN